ncbi:Ion channel protein [Pedobacter sp. HMWF019]|uniref:mechanosensitive ion channel family protein n=1 Tax=Pedobacter sp. HMWF019 TaxID=2056856 RepID=UPI000D3B8E43|nr:mechanosensitive ion channel family protein [Pedobacter sp. HMWF019]PTT01521.1 Ion channel protein [Pedobacter sp. HMWF019]
MKEDPLKKTTDFYDKIFDWIILNGPNLLFAILVLAIGFWLIKILSRWMTNRMHHKDVDSSLRPFLTSLMVTMLRVLLVICAMQIAGIQMTIFAALIGAFGVAAGLALSGTLQNFASGVLILLLKPFQVGDNIIAQGQEGTVSSIQIFYTIVTTFDNRTVVVPNSKLSNEIIINISTIGNRRLDIEIKFGYGIDFETLKPVMQQAVQECKDVLISPKSRIGVSALEESGYKVMVNVWLNAHGFNDAKFIFQEHLMTKLKTAGIKLPGLPE